LVESGWLTIVKAHIALYADRDPPQARRHAQAGVAIGQAIGSREVEMLALAYEGLALVSDGLVTEGMGKLDESSTAAISGELRGVDEAGTIACCLIAACERVRDVGRAAEWCQRLRELSERWAFELMIAVCRTHYASTLVARGHWQEAEREFQAAIAGFGHPHRGQAAEAQVRLAELLIRQGRLDEAAELLDRVDAGAGRKLGHTIALTVRAALLLERGDPQGAADTAETFLRAMPGPESLERAPALETLCRPGPPPTFWRPRRQHPTGPPQAARGRCRRPPTTWPACRLTSRSECRLPTGPPIFTRSRSSPVTCTNGLGDSSGRPLASPTVPFRPVRLGVGRSESGAKSGPPS
jgi:tetratricopeptide repeat protein